jgi:hypothetical protein
MVGAEHFCPRLLLFARREQGLESSAFERLSEGRRTGRGEEITTAHKK